MSIVFAKTRHEYQSYVDFWKLVELSGYETCYVDEIDPDRFAAYIFTPHNGELGPVLERCEWRRGLLIWWFLERLDGTTILQDGTIDRIREKTDAIWVSDQWTASRHEAFKYVCLASHSGLGRDPEDPIYDYTHQSYVWGRRGPVLEQLRRGGLREGPNGWGLERDGVLARSRCMLNIQQYDSPVYAPLRFALAAAYCLPLITETVRAPFPLDERTLIQAPYAELARTTREALKKPDLAQHGHWLFEELCVNRTFGSEVEAAL